jgi:deoxyadenosine/deoxycytidine kinase
MSEFISTEVERYIGKGAVKNMAIVVDGIIGAGKSTLAKFLSESLGMPVYEELVDDGRGRLAQRMLDRFYADQSRWSAIIQVMFLNDRFNDIKKVDQTGEAAIFDRSIYGDEIFAKTIHDRGQMTSDEFRIYRDLLHNMLMHVHPPELLIYIDVSIDTAMQRIQIRDRSTEADMIPRDYMQDLRRNYEQWFERFDLCPKVRIDMDAHALTQDGELTDDMKARILEHIKPHLSQGYLKRLDI